MAEWFLNPGYLAAAAALISIPIIIHLINRFRFKRVRWAAMEFLLKAQKRNRRRLILEQLLLLLLRCLLVALVGFLVLRFVGNFSEFASKQGLHIVVLDDTLSMSDEWKENGNSKTSFQVAKQEILVEKIVKTISQANANDKLVILPMTKLLDPDFSPKYYDRIHDSDRHKELLTDLEAMEATLLHASPQEVMKQVQEIVAKNNENRITMHLLSDFRQRDWNKGEAEKLFDTIKSMVKGARDFKVRLIDVAHPYWTKGQSNPLAHDNVGIVDLRAGTKVAGKSTPVSFTATIANFSSREAEVQMVIYEHDAAGREMLEVDFNPAMPLKISPASSATVSFELRFNPTLKPGQPYYAQISARLKNAQLGDLENDGLVADNVRYAGVEVRERVPILVIDGEGSRSRTEFDKDSFFVQTALLSVPGASFDLVWGDELAGGNAVKALERPDLAKYPSIFLLNVRELSPKQLANLDAYAREGGGVAFFLGPQVSAKYYNKELYKESKGLFPVPLKDTYFPAPSEEARKVEYTGFPQLLLREDLYGNFDNYPVFGNVFKDPKQRAVLKDLPIKRYFQVPRGEWKSEPGKVFELATLPNETPIASFQRDVLDIVRGRLEKVLETEEFKKYRRGLDKHRRTLEIMVTPGSEKLAYHLAPAIDAMLLDKGDKRNPEEMPDLTEFWSNSDPKVGTLRDGLIKLRDQARYGDPLMVAGLYGKGKVVAVMTTAGKEWNDWGGGSEATLIYQPFLWELQNYISSQSAEENRSVGGSVRIVIDGEPFKGKSLKANRVFLKALVGKEAKVVKLGDTNPNNVKGNLVFDFPKNEEPGLYVTQIRADDAPPSSPPIASFGHVFNVDAIKEGNLERVNRDEIESNLVAEFKDQVSFEGAGVSDDSLVTRLSDFSESPWLFLLFLGILVVEQALAVHLSFHVKGNETDVLAKLATK